MQRAVATPCRNTRLAKLRVRTAVSRCGVLGGARPEHDGAVWDQLEDRLASTLARLAAAGPPLDGAVAEELERMSRG